MPAAVLLGVRAARNRLPTWARRTALAVGVVIAAFAAFLSMRHSHSASLRATAGRAVGQRAGALATMGGSGRSRAADGARGHRGAEPARTLDRGRRGRGRIVWAEGFGWRDVVTRTPVTPATRFNIGTAASAVTPPLLRRSG